uniref:Uncharacterized protein n=1 Tax=Amphimedon queenslandica TaxID=400682 RepID=A0A1X7T102_AMPQE
LYTAKLISNEVREAPLMEECIDEFKSSLSFKRKLPKVEEHCQKFLNSFIAVRGSYADAAIALGEDWIEHWDRSDLDLRFGVPQLQYVSDTMKAETYSTVYCNLQYGLTNSWPMEL